MTHVQEWGSAPQHALLDHLERDVYPLVEARVAVLETAAATSPHETADAWRALSDEIARDVHATLDIAKTRLFPRVRALEAARLCEGKWPEPSPGVVEKSIEDIHARRQRVLARCHQLSWAVAPPSVEHAASALAAEVEAAARLEDDVAFRRALDLEPHGWC